MANPYSRPLQYQYKPLGLDAFAAPLKEMQKSYDVTKSAYEDTLYDFTTLSGDEDYKNALERKFNRNLENLQEEFLKTKDYRTAASKLKSLNKERKINEELKGYETNYANYQTENELQKERVKDKTLSAEDYKKWKTVTLGEYNKGGGANYDSKTNEYTSIALNPLSNDMDKEIQEWAYKYANADKANQAVLLSQLSSYTKNDLSNEEGLLKQLRKSNTPEEIAKSVRNALKNSGRFNEFLKDRANLDYRYNMLDDDFASDENKGKRVDEEIKKYEKHKTELEARKGKATTQTEKDQIQQGIDNIDNNINTLKENKVSDLSGIDKGIYMNNVIENRFDSEGYAMGQVFSFQEDNEYAYRNSGKGSGSGTASNLKGPSISSHTYVKTGIDNTVTLFDKYEDDLNAASTVFYDKGGAQYFSAHDENNITDQLLSALVPFDKLKITAPLVTDANGDYIEGSQLADEGTPEYGAYVRQEQINGFEKDRVKYIPQMQQILDKVSSNKDNATIISEMQEQNVELTEDKLNNIRKAVKYNQELGKMGAWTASLATLNQKIDKVNNLNNLVHEVTGEYKNDGDVFNGTLNIIDNLIAGKQTEQDALQDLKLINFSNNVDTIPIEDYNTTQQKIYDNFVEDLHNKYLENVGSDATAMDKINPIIDQAAQAMTADVYIDWDKYAAKANIMSYYVHGMSKDFNDRLNAILTDDADAGHLTQFQPALFASWGEIDGFTSEAGTSGADPSTKIAKGTSKLVMLNNKVYANVPYTTGTGSDKSNSSVLIDLSDPSGMSAIDKASVAELVDNFVIESTKLQKAKPSEANLYTYNAAQSLKYNFKYPNNGLTTAYAETLPYSEGTNFVIEDVAIAGNNRMQVVQVGLKEGKVRYELLRITPNGVKNRIVLADNNGEATDKAIHFPTPEDAKAYLAGTVIGDVSRRASIYNPAVALTSY